MKIKIDKELFQWEKNRYVYLEASEDETEVSFIQFYNKLNQSAPEVPLIDNKAQIPNSLLKESLPIMAVACTSSKEGFQVITRRQFKVLKRAKPESYKDEEDKIEVIYDGGMET